MLSRSSLIACAFLALFQQPSLAQQSPTPVRSYYESIEHIAGHVGEPSVAFVSPDRGILLTGAQDGKVKMWNATTGAFIRNLVGHIHFVRLIATLGDYAFSWGDDSTFRAWNMTAGVEIEQLPYSIGCLVPYTAAQSLLFCSGNDVIQMEYPSKQVIRTFSGHTEAVTGVVITDNTFFSTSNDLTIRRWSFDTGLETISFSTGAQNVRNLGLYGADKIFGTFEGEVRIWQYNGNVVKIFTPPNRSDSYWHICAMIIGDLLISGSFDGIRVYNILTEEELTQSLAIDTRGLSADSTRFYTANMDGRNRAWDLTTQAMVWETIPNHGMGPAISNGQRVWIGRAGDIHEYEIATGRLVRKLTGHTAGISQMLFQGNFLFSASHDATVRQWNTNTGALIRAYTDAGWVVAGIALSNNQLISVSWDRNVRVYNINNGELVRTIPDVMENHVIYSMAVRDNLIFLGQGDDDWYEVPMKVYDWTNGTFMWEIRTFDVSTFSVLVRDNDLFVADGWGVNHYDTRTKEKLRTFYIPGNAGPICSTAVSGNYLFGTQCYWGDQGTFMWEIDTGNFVRRFWPPGTPYIRGSQLFLPNNEGTTPEFHIPELYVPPVTTTEAVAPEEPTPTTEGGDNAETAPTTSARGRGNSDGRASSDAWSVLQSNNVVIPVAASGVFIGATLAFVVYRSRYQQAKTRYDTMMTTITASTASDMTSLTMTQEMPTITAITALTGGPAPGEMTSAIGAAGMTINQTAVTQTYEVSIPAFLEMRWGLDFRQDAFIAKGGGGSIYHGSSIEFELSERSKGQPLAVKNVAESIETMDDKMRTAFFQEISLMWRFREHPNFIRMYAYSTRPVSMVMKFYDLGDMSRFIFGKGEATKRGHVYSKATVISLLKQFCIGIEFMHQNGIAHCDVKPANVLLDVQNNALVAILTDFGISRIVNKEQMKVQSFTAADLRGASIAYAAPEVITRFRKRLNEVNADVWKAGDTYALAITMFQMIIRSHPWRA